MFGECKLKAPYKNANLLIEYRCAHVFTKTKTGFKRNPKNDFTVSELFTLKLHDLKRKGANHFFFQMKGQNVA